MTPTVVMPPRMGRPGFALCFLFERELVANMDVRIEDSRQHDFAGGVDHVRRRRGEFPDSGNPAAADPDIRRDRSHGGNDERATAHDKIEA